MIDRRTGRRGYRPARIGSYALSCWNAYRQSGEERFRNVFLTCAEWFMKCENGRFPYDFESGGLKAPWISGLSQGQGISVLVRAYLLTHDDRFMMQSRKALQPMIENIEKGGLSSRLGDGSFFIEEYPLTKPRHVLNGFLSALFGILDLHRVDTTQHTTVVVDDCWETLHKNIDHWNLHGWSAYDLHNYDCNGPRNYSTVSYHSVHIVQLQYASVQSDNTRFHEIACLWQKSLESRTKRMHAHFAKIRYRIGDRIWGASSADVDELYNSV
jgi:heparosan-N-sulfate-glucuronate 5-epimerase